MLQKRFLRTILSTALAAALLATGVYAAEGGQETAAPDAAQPAVQTEIAGPVRVWGAVKELGENQVRLENGDDQDPYREIVLTVGDSTAILDAVTGQPKAFADLKAGETLYAYVGPAMTMSLPPMANAEVILCNIPADFGVPTYAEVQSVTAREDGGVDAYVTGDVILHLSADTVLTSYLTKNTVGLDDIKPGTRVLSWYDMVALSMPAQAAPTKVLVFPYGYAGYVTVTQAGVLLDGAPMETAAGQSPRQMDGKTMLSVRALAEALGCTVTWEAGTNTVAVSSGEETLYRFAIGGGVVVRGEGDETAVTTFAENGVTFMALEDLAALHNLKVETPAF